MLEVIISKGSLTKWCGNTMCPACPIWSHFIQDKIEITIYLSLDKHKENFI